LKIKREVNYTVTHEYTYTVEFEISPEDLKGDIEDLAIQVADVELEKHEDYEYIQKNDDIQIKVYEREEKCPTPIIS